MQSQGCEKRLSTPKPAALSTGQANSENCENSVRDVGSRSRRRGHGSAGPDAVVGQVALPLTVAHGRPRPNSENSENCGNRYRHLSDGPTEANLAILRIVRIVRTVRGTRGFPRAIPRLTDCIAVDSLFSELWEFWGAVCWCSWNETSPRNGILRIVGMKYLKPSVAPTPARSYPTCMKQSGPLLHRNR